jgi:hypothetical protein
MALVHPPSIETFRLAIEGQPCPCPHPRGTNMPVHACLCVWCVAVRRMMTEAARCK